MQRTVRVDQLKEGDVINLNGRAETVDFIDAGVQLATVYTDRYEHVLGIEQTVIVTR